LYKVHEHEHSYPVCWRCKTEVIFKAVREWYIDTDELRPRLIKAANSVKWEPEHMGKRMVDWLSNMDNWAISRKRFYGLPLPFYVCDECGEVTVVGSREELKNLAVDADKVDSLPDLHRPWIDEIEIKCPHCQASVKRITEVGDCWLDAGIVPFSTLNYFKDRSVWEKYYPAEWITEMKEQVRLWFYSMLFMSVVLEDRAPYEKVLAYSTVVAEDGSKFSKTGFMIKFDEAAEKIGADPARYLYASSPITSDVRFGFNLGDEARRKLLGFWNIYVFFSTYAILDMPDFSNIKIDYSKLNLSDKWLLARINNFVKKAKDAMESYQTSVLVKEFELIVDDISNWYVRINRKRFWKSEKNEDKVMAYYCLYNAIKILSQIMAPVIPFMTEEIWQNLVRTFEPNEAESVHLSDYPKVIEEWDNDIVLNETVEARNVIALGMLLRNEKQIKVRQPLSKLYINCKDNIKDAISKWENIITEELNIKDIIFISDGSELNQEYLTVNFKVAGMVLKEKVQDFKKFMNDASSEQLSEYLDHFNKNEKVNIPELGEFDCDIFMKQSKPKDNIAVTKNNNVIVAIDISLDEELILEGMYRDLVRAIQVLRKEADLKVDQRITLGLNAKGENISKVIEKYCSKLGEETLATKTVIGDIESNVIEKEIEINNELIKVSIAI